MPAITRDVERDKERESQPCLLLAPLEDVQHMRHLLKISTLTHLHTGAQKKTVFGPTDETKRGLIIKVNYYKVSNDSCVEYITLQ